MPNIARRFGDALDTVAGHEASLSRRPVPARVERAVNHGVAIEHGRGIVTAARVRALEYVAHEAMQSVGHLSQLQEFWSRQVPSSAGRMQAIADIATIQAADIVADMGRD